MGKEVRKKDRAKWIFLGVILLIFVIILVFYFNNPLNKGKRFVDSIIKITEAEDKDIIQSQLNESQYARIWFELDSLSNLNETLLSLPKEGFVLEGTSTYSEIDITGNATKSALVKLEKNSHILKIHATHIYVAQAENMVENSIKVNKNKDNITFKKEYLEWLNQTKQWLDFNNPYVKCLYEKTCNGSLSISMKVNYSLCTTSPSIIKNILSRYGNITRFYAYDSIQRCRVNLEVKDFEIVNEFIDLPFISEVLVDEVNSGYGSDITEEMLKSCKVDSDCTIINTGGCCGSTNLINRKYTSLIEQRSAISCLHIGCINDPTPLDYSQYLNYMTSTAIKCLNNSCQFVSGNEYPCNSFLYAKCRDETPKSQWNESNCTDSVKSCEGNMSKEEIYQLCLNRTIVPEKYNPKQVIVTFDSSNDTEIEQFVKNAGLNLTVITHYSKYLIRNEYDPWAYAKAKGLEEGYGYKPQVIEELIKKPCQALVDYLNSFPQYVLNVDFYYNDISAAIWVKFYGNVSLDLAMKIIENYSNIGEYYPPQFIEISQTRIINVPEGREKEFICKLKEEKIITTANFDSTD